MKPFAELLHGPFHGKTVEQVNGVICMDGRLRVTTFLAIGGQEFGAAAVYADDPSRWHTARFLGFEIDAETAFAAGLAKEAEIHAHCSDCGFKFFGWSYSELCRACASLKAEGEKQCSDVS